MNCEFSPTWFTTSDFATLKKIDPFSKEICRKEIDSPIKNYHALARAKFSYDGKGRVFIRITADDYYVLYVNGKYAACGPAPSYHTGYYYNELEITDYLEEGENLLAAHLYYQGLVNRVWQSADNRFGIATVIENRQSGKREEPVWKYTKTEAFYGNIVGYGTDFSENFDSRLWERGWNTKEYDDSLWQRMLPSEHDYIFVRQPVRQLDVYATKPQNVKFSNGVYFVDVGREIVGALRVKAVGKRGEVVTLRFGEELDGNGRVRFNLRANCRYEEMWTLSGGEDTFENYTYKGYRYAEIEAGDAQITLIEAVCRHYPFDDYHCVLKTDDDKLQKIFTLCKNTIKYSTQYSFIDCPTREKGQYLGDAFIAGHSHALLTGKTDMLEKAILDFAETSSVCPGLMAVSSCSFMQEIADYSLIFGEMLLLAYSLNKNRKFLEKYYDTARGIILHFEKFKRDDGLIACVNDKWNLVDWPENLRDGYDFELLNPIKATGVHNVINAYYAGAVKTLNEIEDILGAEKSFDFEALKRSYIAAFSRENGLFADSEVSDHFSLHSNVFALYFDLVPSTAKGAVADYIVQKSFSCGVYVSYFLLKALCRAGRRDDAYKLIVNESERGWMNMLREGATTCFEAWGKEQKHNLSLCHPWATSAVPIILEDLKIATERGILELFCT